MNQKKNQTNLIKIILNYFTHHPQALHLPVHLNRQIHPHPHPHPQVHQNNTEKVQKVE